MIQELLSKISKKNKIILVLFCGSIFLIMFTFLQKDKKEYYQNKLEEFQQSNQDNQFKKEVLDRYQKFLNEAEKENRVLDIPLSQVNENLLEIIQNSKIKVLAVKDVFEDYEDFSLGQKQIQILATYKNLNQFLTDLKKTNVWISTIKINNSSIYAKNPKLNIQMMIYFIATSL